MFLGSQLIEISSRFPAHVQDVRELLLKEKLPVPSADAIPQLSSRLKTDERFRADVASLMRATLYQEREGIGYEDLLGILVVAAAGTEQDLSSESHEAEIREMLRFLLQSRRVTFRPEEQPEEARVAAAEPAPRESVPVRVQLTSEPVRAKATQPDAPSMKLELKGTELPVAVAEEERREPDDVVLPPLRTSGLFASQAELDPPRSGRHSLWIVGVVCMLLGLGLGLTFRRVVSAAERHITLHAANKPSSKPTTVGSVAPSVVPQETSQASPSSPPQRDQDAADDGTAVRPAAPLEGRSTPPPPVIADVSAGVPVTVVKQVVTASPVADDEGEGDAAQLTAKTRSIVRQGSAGMTAANVVYSPAPEYPAAAAAARVHGEVTVHAVVDPDGKVIYARAVSGPPALRDAAQEAVQKWRYSPLLDNGKPIAVATTAVLDFRFAR